jgi:hypothetical protein
MKSSKLQVIGAKTEASQGEEATLDTVDYLLVESAEVNPIPEFLSREYKHKSASQLASILGKVWVEIKLKIPIRGWASVPTNEEETGALGAILKACGLSEGFSPPSEDMWYSLGNNGEILSGFFGFGKSCTILIYEAGPNPVKHKAIGCIAKSAKLSAKAGAPMVLECVLQGLYSAPIDEAFPEVAYVSTLEPILQNGMANINYGELLTLIFSNFELDFGLESDVREDANSPHGVKGFAILNIKMTGSIDPEVQNLSTLDYYSKLLSGQTGHIGFKINGLNVGNHWSYGLTDIQLSDVTHADRGLIKVFKIPFQTTEESLFMMQLD